MPAHAVSGLLFYAINGLVGCHRNSGTACRVGLMACQRLGGLRVIVCNVPANLLPFFVTMQSLLDAPRLTLRRLHAVTLALSRCRTAHGADAAARAARRRTRRWWRRRARCCACTRSASACACSATARGARPRARRCAACARATTRRAQTLQGPGGTGACSPRQGHGFGVAVQPSSPVHASGVDHEPETLD